jgi:hypothetical protein
VHNDGRARKKFLDFADDLKVQALLPFELVRAMACADGSGNESQPVWTTNSTASLGSVKKALPSSTCTSSSTPPSRPNSASTLKPLACARSTTRFVVATFSSKGSWLASIITEL